MIALVSVLSSFDSCIIPRVVVFLAAEGIVLSLLPCMLDVPGPFRRRVSEFRVWGLGCRVYGLGFRVLGYWFRIQAFGI